MKTLRLLNINTKMPTRTKSVEISKNVSDSEIHLHHCLWESRGFKIGRSNHQKCSVKKVFLKILKMDRKAPVSESDTDFLLSVLRIFWEHVFTEHFRATAFDEEAWWSKILILCR